MTSAVVASWRMLARHQVASLVATAADFTVMTLLVECLGVAPETATFGGALFGAVINFTLNRRYTFRSAGRNAARTEAFRYSLVSGASAILNATGEYIGTKWLDAPYLLVRVLVSVAVSLGWNYPLHRSFVFRDEATAEESWAN